jgi:hypothetical protein
MLGGLNFRPVPNQSCTTAGMATRSPRDDTSLATVDAPRRWRKSTRSRTYPRRGAMTSTDTTKAGTMGQP